MNRKASIRLHTSDPGSTLVLGVHLNFRKDFWGWIFRLSTEW